MDNELVGVVLGGGTFGDRDTWTGSAILAFSAVNLFFDALAVAVTVLPSPFFPSVNASALSLPDGNCNRNSRTDQQGLDSRSPFSRHCGTSQGCEFAYGYFLVHLRKVDNVQASALSFFRLGPYIGPPLLTHPSYGQLATVTNANMKPIAAHLNFCHLVIYTSACRKRAISTRLGKSWGVYATLSLPACQSDRCARLAAYCKVVLAPLVSILRSGFVAIPLVSAFLFYLHLSPSFPPKVNPPSAVGQHRAGYSYIGSQPH